MNQKNTYQTKLNAISILFIFIVGVLIGIISEYFRYSNYRWIYNIGSTLKFLMIICSIGWSFLHPILFFSKRKNEWKNDLIWIIIGFIPFLYFFINLLVIMFF